MREVPCLTCNGKRLRPEVLAVTINSYSIADICDMPIEKSLEWINSLKLEGSSKIIAKEIVKRNQGKIRILK